METQALIFYTKNYNVKEKFEKFDKLTIYFLRK